MAYLFFSYARRNTTQAQENLKAFAAAGFMIWQDIRGGNAGIRPGALFPREIESAIQSDDCKGVILQWSKEANDSEWVPKEIDLAYTAGKPIYPLTLDETPLPENLKEINGIQQEEIDRLINSLYDEASETIRDFTLELRSQYGVEPLRGSSEFVKVLLIPSTHTKAYIVGYPDHVIGAAPEHVLLCAEFTGKPGTLFLREALHYFQKTYENVPYAALHVTPTRTPKGEYVLGEPPEWEDAAATCFDAVEFFRQPYGAEVHVFAKMPVVLALLLSNKFETGTIFHLYNDIESADRRAIAYEFISTVTK